MRVSPLSSESAVILRSSERPSRRSFPESPNGTPYRPLSLSSRMTWHFDPSSRFTTASRPTWRLFSSRKRCEFYRPNRRFQHSSHDLSRVRSFLDEGGKVALASMGGRRSGGILQHVRNGSGRQGGSCRQTCVRAHRHPEHLSSNAVGFDPCGRSGFSIL